MLEPLIRKPASPRAVTNARGLSALHHGICRHQKVPERSCYSLQMNIFWCFTNICFKKRTRKKQGTIKQSKSRSRCINKNLSEAK